MRSGESSRVFQIGVLCIVALLVGAGLSRGICVVQAQKNPDPLLQTTQDPTMPATTPRGAARSDGLPDLMDGPSRARMNEARMKAFNVERHKRLEDDAGKLLALSTELKTDVDKTDKDELSLEVMRKAAEIEKLAHDVQSRMKN